MEITILLSKILGTILFFIFVIFGVTSAIKDYYWSLGVSKFVEKSHQASSVVVKWTIITAIVTMIILFVVSVLMLIWK